MDRINSTIYATLGKTHHGFSQRTQLQILEDTVSEDSVIQQKHHGHSRISLIDRKWEVTPSTCSIFFCLSPKPLPLAPVRNRTTVNMKLRDKPEPLF